MINNEERTRVWRAYGAGKPIRVPVGLYANPRVVLLDARWNPKGYSFEEYYRRAEVAVEMQLTYMEYNSWYLPTYCDSPSGRPEKFAFYVDCQNVYDAAYFGCPMHFRDGQVVDISPILTGADKNRIFDFDAEHPLENPFVKESYARYEAIVPQASKVSLPGTQFEVAPVYWGFDGHLTIATQLRGAELFEDITDDPDYVVRLMQFIANAVEVRNRVMCKLAGADPFPAKGFFADDSIQLISTDMYRQLVLPLHRKWYKLFGAGPHMIHLCGDATRHFATISRELNVDSFDTGFPVNHGALRRELGPAVEIVGGVEVALLLGATPQQVYERGKAILTSGVKEGGRFVLREANNLPPRCPDENLAAYYKAGLDFGGY